MTFTKTYKLVAANMRTSSGDADSEGWSTVQRSRTPTTQAHTLPKELSSPDHDRKRSRRAKDAMRKKRAAAVDKIGNWRQPDSKLSPISPPSATLFLSSPSSCSEPEPEPEQTPAPGAGRRKRYMARKERQKTRKALFVAARSSELSAAAIPFVPDSDSSSTAADLCPSAPPRFPEGGKLKDLCSYLFCQAYGLRGVMRRPHEEVVRDAMALTGCSERAIQECLYGHSYTDQLGEVRAMIPVYPSKVRSRGRAQAMEEILKNLHSHPLYSFDGNQVQSETDLEVTDLQSDFEFEQQEAGKLEAPSSAATSPSFSIAQPAWNPSSVLWNLLASPLNPLKL